MLQGKLLEFSTGIFIGIIGLTLLYFSSPVFAEQQASMPVVSDDAEDPSFKVEVPAEAAERLRKAIWGDGTSDEAGETRSNELDPSAVLTEFGDKVLATEARRTLVFQWAREGLPEAQARLGGGYANGRYLPKDIQKAAYWYKRAAEQGHARAQSSLSDIYMGYSDASMRDVPKSLKWIRAAVGQGIDPGPYALWNIRSEIKLGNRYRFDQDDLDWLALQLSGGETEEPGVDPELARCHSAADSRIVECYTWQGECDLIGCQEEVSCRGSGPFGRCARRNYGPYGESGTFYCDPNNNDNVDFNRDIVIRDACNGKFGP